MRGTWIIAALIGAGLVVAGFFAQGMARLAGLPASVPRPVPSASATPVAASAPAPTPAVAAQPATPTALSTAEPAATLGAPDIAASSPTLQALAAAPEAAIELQPAAAAARVPAPAARRVVAAPVESGTRGLSAAEVRDAQCRSLGAWLGELDAMAQARPDAASQSWVQSQRATTRERQIELRC